MTRRAAAVALVWLAVPAVSPGVAEEIPTLTETVGAPLRIRDFTFPSFLVLGLAPAPAAPLGKGRVALEVHYSVVNDYQVSPTVEEYFARTRNGERRPLDQADVEFIQQLPLGKGFYIDGEFDFVELAAYWGVTDRLDVGVSAYYVGYSGGQLDGSIFDFHDRYGFGQQGRQYVADNQFQVVLATEQGFALLEPPTSGGLSDLALSLRYALPVSPGGWLFNIGAAVKAPTADERSFLSTGSWDVGAQLMIERPFERNSVLLNLAVVWPGRFEQTGFEPPSLPSATLAWIHQFKRLPRLRWVIQGLVAEHPFRDLVDSALSELEFQITTGFKLYTAGGIFGLGLTENVSNFDNTPDIGLHFTWGLVVGE